MAHVQTSKQSQGWKKKQESRNAPFKEADPQVACCKKVAHVETQSVAKVALRTLAYRTTEAKVVEDVEQNLRTEEVKYKCCSNECEC